MTLKVIGAGFGRTGTDSMRTALDMLGLGPCHHMRALIGDPGLKAKWRQRAARGTPDWPDIFEGFHSTIDWPSAHYWPELINAYPDAKVILTWRTAESWWKSFEKTILPVWQASTETEEEAPGSQLLARVFDWEEPTRDHCIAVYERNVARVLAEVPPGRLLLHRLGDGWGPLCAHLGLPVPDVPYPSANSTASFRKEAEQEGVISGGDASD
jgi:hypothetical protein